MNNLKIKGSTVINHEQRVALYLNCSEYVLMNYIADCAKKKKAYTNFNCFEQTGFNDKEQQILLERLINKGFILPDKNEIPVISDLWNSVNKGAKEQFEEFWKYKWPGSKKEAFNRFLKVIKIHSFSYLMKQVKDYHKYLHLEKTVRGFDRQKLMASVFLNPAKERFAEPWGEYCDKIKGINKTEKSIKPEETKSLFEKNER